MLGCPKITPSVKCLAPDANIKLWHYKPIAVLARSVSYHYLQGFITKISTTLKNSSFCKINSLLSYLYHVCNVEKDLFQIQSTITFFTYFTLHLRKSLFGFHVCTSFNCSSASFYVATIEQLKKFAQGLPWTWPTSTVLQGATSK